MATDAAAGLHPRSTLGCGNEPGAFCKWQQGGRVRLLRGAEGAWRLRPDGQSSQRYRHRRSSK
ncbi:hypothetical protein CBM2589_A90184 [Cupriavidus taiwanensis]|uniref:Uncharacterized protein n=1 Tax=Cupriavidus taiwanensis TaxID=164546 RepID=A0A375CEK0_9BURK|nr:hypothetical protein CBM2589_A90184 [Cupriavidus taiwanensis]